MRVLLYAILLPLSPAAQSLLANGSFEEENICSEYKINCAPEAWIHSVSSSIYYFKEVKLARTGLHFVGVTVGSVKKPLYRTFLQSKLLCGMQAGKTYRIDFFVKSQHEALDSMGILFSDYDLLFTKTAVNNIKPSLYFKNAMKKPVNTDTGWQQLSFNYKAQGHEQFFSLAYFGRKPLRPHNRPDDEDEFQVFFDDVSVTPLDPYERLCTDWKQTKEEIYAQNDRHEFLDKSVKVNRNNPPPPKKSSTTVTVKVDTLIIPDVLFATSSFMMNKKAIMLLDSFATQVSTTPIDSIVVIGHTDSRGTETFNKELSWRRANTVAAYFDKKIKTKIESRGLGSDKPVADNWTAVGRQRNRRVEIFVYKK